MCRGTGVWFCVLFVFLSAHLDRVFADDTIHRYQPGEEVTLWLNKIGPQHNPQETYGFYRLPFCKPELKEIRHKHDSLGVVLEGNDLIDSGLSVRFLEPQETTPICALKLGRREKTEFWLAIRDRFWYQLYIDELPVWGMVGEYMAADFQEVDQPHHRPKEYHQSFIYTHKSFSIAYNGDRVIEVNLTSGGLQPLEEDRVYQFTYSVEWVPTSTPFNRRFDRYLESDFFEHQVHWISIANSFMMVILLLAVMSFILLRTLRQDYARYSAGDEELELETIIIDESGWKKVRGDVFRPPKFLILFAVLLGTGLQLCCIVFGAILFALLGNAYYDGRGSAASTLLLCYSVTALVAGLGSGSWYKLFGGRHWKRVMFATAALFPALCLVIFTALNVIAISYSSQQALSLSTLVAMFSIWLSVQCPLVVVGTLVGRSRIATGDFSATVNSFRRPVPRSPWYSRPMVVAGLAGLLPFGTIFMEMYFIFTSFWNYKFYYVYGFMLLVFAMLLAVTTCVAIVVTYLLLNAENHRWQWTSFFGGASTGVYVWLYGVYYFFFRTRMHGLMQTSYYFAYIGLFSLGLCLLNGTVAYLGSLFFVNRIYQQIKTD